MRILRSMPRVLVPDLGAALPFYEGLTGRRAAARFALPGAGVEVAAVGDLLLVGGGEEALRPFRETRATLLVDDLEAFREQILAAGGAILRGPQEVPTGWNLTARHPDGTVVEYVQHRPPALPPLPAALTTPRLLLRRYRPDDAAWYLEMGLRNRDHLLPFEEGNAALQLRTAAEAAQLLREFAADWEARRCFYLGAFARASGRFAAQVYVGPVSPAAEVELGYFADRDHEGQGLVTEAVRAAVGWVFANLAAHRIAIRCDDTNLRSARVAERCGFTREGHAREDHPRPGGPTGTLRYGLLRGEAPAAAPGGAVG